MRSEDWNIFPPCAKRRRCDHIESEAIEKIFAEPAFLCEQAQVDVRSRDDPHIGEARLAAADAFILAILDDAQKLFLNSDARCRDFVEKKRSTLGALKAPGVPLRCAGERADFMSELFAVEKFFCERGAVEFDEWSFPAG